MTKLGPCQLLPGFCLRNFIFFEKKTFDAGQRSECFFRVTVMTRAEIPNWTSDKLTVLFIDGK